MLKFLHKCRYLLQFTETATPKARNLLKTSYKNLPKLCSKQAPFCTKQPGIEEGDGFDVLSVAQGDPTIEHKLKVILLETEVMRQEGKAVPSNDFLKKQHWEELLKLETRTARTKYLLFLFKIEKKKENEIYKKEKKRLEREQTVREPLIEGAMRYDLGHNNILLRVYDTTINQLYNNKLIQAMQFGQQLVIDCGYDTKMTTRENINCAKQLMYVFGDNRVHDDPFDIHFCNANLNSTLIKYLHRHIPTLFDPDFPLNLHEESYLDRFPKEQLIYLTPHCRDEMHEFDHNAVYIIGGIVDKINNEPLSLAKAKKQGLRMAKFPLDKYLQWGCGSGKSLTLNHVVSILLDVKTTGDWNFALRHVPKRKLVNENETSFSDRQSFRRQVDRFSGDDRKEMKRERTLWKPAKFKDAKVEKKEPLVQVRNILSD